MNFGHKGQRAAVAVRSRNGGPDVPLQAPADGRLALRPPTFRSSTLNWRLGDKIPLTAERTLRGLGVRDEDADQPSAGRWRPARIEVPEALALSTERETPPSGYARRRCAVPVVERG